MAFKSLIKGYPANTQDAIDDIKDLLVSAGWSVHDDRSAASPYGYVMTSTGSSTTEWPAYIYINSDGANWIDFYIYNYWDATAHSGGFYLSHAYNRVPADDDAAFYLWVSADLDWFVVGTYVTEYNCYGFTLIDPVTEDAYGEITSGVSSGSSVVLQLGTGEATGFEVGASYQFFGETYRTWVEVSAVNTSTDQITLTSLSYNMEAGAMIGNQPHKWVGICTDTGLYCFKFTYNINGNGNESSAYSAAYLLSTGYTEPDERSHSKYIMQPYFCYDASNAALGGFPVDGFGMMYMDTNLTSSEHTVSINESESGTSSGSNTSTTLNDTSKSWTTNEHQDLVVIITGGTGAGQFNTIASNTSTALTVNTAWGVTPDATSTYCICEEGWMHFYCNNNASSQCAMLLMK